MGRAPCCDKVGLKSGRWSAEEDAILINYIKHRGEAAGSWRSVPKNAGLLRCGKSCRLRWINYLRSDLRRGNFTSHEQDTIINLHASLGSRWSLIANQLEGRTDNEIKNYWNSTLSRRSTTADTLISSSSPPQTVSSLPSAAAVGQGAGVIAIQKRGGRTSRAAMKKNKTSTYAKSNKYHQPQLAASATAKQAPCEISNPFHSTTSSYDDLAIVSSSPGRRNCTATYDTSSFVATTTSSALTLPQTPNVGKKDLLLLISAAEEDQICSDDALKSQGLVFDSLLCCQTDGQSVMDQNNESLDAAYYCEGLGLPVGDDDGMMANIYIDDDELAVEVDVPSNNSVSTGRCDDADDKAIRTMETSSVLLVASPAQAADINQDADWDWMNDYIVHPDIIDNRLIWGDEQDGIITWLWEYEYHQQCMNTNKLLS